MPPRSAGDRAAAPAPTRARKDDRRQHETSEHPLAALLDELPRDLYRQVFTHASWAPTRADSYERLAFLGDVVLSLAVSTNLLPRFGEYGAGRLTKLRAQAVSGSACARVARAFAADERLRAEAPAEQQRAVAALIESERVLASICEAAIGACYLAFGLERTRAAVLAAFAEEIERAIEQPFDFKSLLQERLARRAETVEYRIEEEEGPPHRRRFRVAATAGGRVLGRGSGRSKKAAEQEAALAALEQLEREEELAAWGRGDDDRLAACARGDDQS